MKISQLLRHLELIQATDNASALADMSARFQAMQTALPDITKEAGLAHNAVEALRSAMTATLKHIEHITGLEHDLRDHLQQLINQQDQAYLTRSERAYRDQFSHAKPNDILALPSIMTAEQKQLLLARIQRYVTWQDIGLFVRPRRDDMVDAFGAMGLLYLFDHSASMLADATARFPEQQRDRIRSYHGSSADALALMPQSQMRLIFVREFFNTMSLDVIAAYLQRFQSMLRPDGVLICTFNDCDHSVNADMAEKNYQSYVPGRLLRAQAEALGLTVIDQRWFDNGLAWMEFQRPGKYRALKGAPISTKIHARPK